MLTFQMLFYLTVTYLIFQMCKTIKSSDHLKMKRFISSGY